MDCLCYSLLDSSSGFDCDTFKRLYANVLFQFGLHTQRVELLKCIESTLPRPHVGLGLYFLITYITAPYQLRGYNAP